MLSVTMFPPPQPITFKVARVDLATQLPSALNGGVIQINQEKGKS